jgi:hypothetical protein
MKVLISRSRAEARAGIERHRRGSFDIYHGTKMLELSISTHKSIPMGSFQAANRLWLTVKAWSDGPSTLVGLAHAR